MTSYSRASVISPSPSDPPTRWILRESSNYRWVGRLSILTVRPQQRHLGPAEDEPAGAVVDLAPAHAAAVLERDVVHDGEHPRPARHGGEVDGQVQRERRLRRAVG